MSRLLIPSANTRLLLDVSTGSVAAIESLKEALSASVSSASILLTGEPEVKNEVTKPLSKEADKKAA